MKGIMKKQLAIAATALGIGAALYAVPATPVAHACIPPQGQTTCIDPEESPSCEWALNDPVKSNVAWMACKSGLGAQKLAQWWHNKDCDAAGGKGHVVDSGFCN